MKIKVTMVIFSDLDGTLLHPETYSFEAAQPALDAVRRMKIPLVLCSSKSRAELELYKKRLSNTHPFVSENGGGIFSPRDYFSPPLPGEIKGDSIMTKMGMPYSRIREEFTELRSRLGIQVRGFGDMTAEEVESLTKLPPEEAVLARQRDFSEPFIFPHGIEDQIFLKAAEARGLQWTRGRFHCLMGEHDKGKSVRFLKKAYEKEHGKIISMGLGDALNDLPLLREVDVPVLVQKKDGTYDPGVRVDGLVFAPGTGPEGWNKAVLNVLRDERFL